MAQGPHPLLRLDRPGRPVERTTGVRLTDTGARMLAGEADQIALNGIDRWIGGVQIRLPRVLAAVVVGAGLSASGASYQSMFRNPLVSPDILGVSAAPVGNHDRHLPRAARRKTACAACAAPEPVDLLASRGVAGCAGACAAAADRAR